MHLYTLSSTQVQRFPTLRHLHSAFWDFTDEVCHVMKVTVAERNEVRHAMKVTVAERNEVCHVIKIPIAERNPDTGLLTQQKFCFSPEFVTGDKKMPVTTVSLSASLWVGPNADRQLVHCGHNHGLNSSCRTEQENSSVQDGIYQCAQKCP